MTDTPRTKAVYQQIYDGCASSADSIVRMTMHAKALEREIAWQRERADALLNQVNHWKDFAQRLTGVDANDHGWLRAELESQWRKKEGEPRVVARPDPDGARYRMLVTKRQGWFSRFAPCDVLREGIGMKGVMDRALDKLIEEEPLASESEEGLPAITALGANCPSNPGCGCLSPTGPGICRRSVDSAPGVARPDAGVLDYARRVMKYHAEAPSGPVPECYSYRTVDLARALLAGEPSPEARPSEVAKAIEAITVSARTQMIRDEQSSLAGLIRWLDVKGAASTVCKWGDSPGITIRALIEQYRGEESGVGIPK